MLKSKKSKIIIGALVVLCVLIASSIWVSMSFKKNQVDEFGYSNLADVATDTTMLTQIDHIIENANAADSDAREDYDTSNYYIYIIVPSDASKTSATGELNAFLADGGFQNYIINDNRTIDTTMPDGKVVPVFKTIAELNAMADMTTELGKADMIYVYAPSNVAYTETAAISEDLYECLHNYAFGAGKPLIMNYELSNSGSGDDNTDDPSNIDTSSNMYSLLVQDFKNSWKRYKTTNVSAWDGTQENLTDIENVLKDYMSSVRSTYTQYRANQLTLPAGYASWTDYWTRTSPDGVATLNVLYVYGNGTAYDFTGLAEWMINADTTNGGQDAVFGSSSLSADLPTAAQAVSKKASELTVDDFYVTLDDGSQVKKYDYIFIAPDAYSAQGDNACDISSDVRIMLNELSADTNGLTYILFGTLETPSTGSTGSTTTKPESLTIDTSTNYGKLIDLSITTTGYAKKNNIMVVGTAYMKTLASDPVMNPTKVSEVVALINKSTYRGYAGNGSGAISGSVSTTAFRVLELQPCYPIDLEKALSSTITTNLSSYNGYNKQGNYYTVPANVLNTSEIDNYVQSDGTIATEYYQWDLSKAKIAYALNMPADNIELVQMSTEEFITSKADVTDSYDLIYIGGNTSAFKPSTQYNYFPNYYANLDAVSNSATYTMYKHTGELAGLIKSWTSSYTATVYNGNDITYDRLEALKDYISSGMPIVFSNEVWRAYEDAAKNGYENQYIDPDSNMFALLKFASSANNALKGWNIKTKGTSSNSLLSEYWTSTTGEKGQVKTVSNTDGMYGTASKVTVFNDELSDQLYNCVYVTASGLRPKYTIETNAIEYSDKDASTRLTERNLTWKIKLLNEITNHTYKAVLLEDKNDNAVFDYSKNQDSEVISAEVIFTNGVAELSYTYPSGDYGAFSWKVLVVDVTGNTGDTITDTSPSTGYSTISMIARSEDQPKKAASILEIMPMTTSDYLGGGVGDNQDGHTLYLDSAYQQARGSAFLYSSYAENAFLDEAGNVKAGYLSADGTIINTPKIYGYAPTVKTIVAGNSSYWSSKDINFTDNGVAWMGPLYLGMYQTHLSLNRYDSLAEHEDWTYNYVAQIEEDYDLTLDIMYMDDIEYYATKSRTLTDDQRKNYLEIAEEQKEIYDSYNTKGTVQYNALAQAEAQLRTLLISIKNGNDVVVTLPSGNQVTVANSAFNTYDIDGILESRQYYRFFYLNNGYNYSDDSAECMAAYYFAGYNQYIQQQDKMIHAYRLYRHYNLLAYGPEEYLRENYDVVVIGFYDDAIQGFRDFSENSSADLQAFLDADGSVLMTHDNMTKYTAATAQGGKAATNLTNTLRSYAGMQRFGEITTQTGTESSVLPHYLTTDKDKYFFTNLSNKLNLSKNVSDTDSEWNSKVSSWLAARSDGLSQKSIGYPGFTDQFVFYETNQAQAVPYSFVEFQIEEQIKWNLAYTAYAIRGTTKATQVNRGVVTTYPFYVSSDLRISPTHTQAYALDLEDEDVTVWYTLAADSAAGTNTSGGSTNYQLLKENSSFYAASPKDGMDSYFIYSVGNVTYCGAGHAQVTGEQRDNNDERKLFLNVLVNMAKRSGETKDIKEADIALYDPDGVTKAPGYVVKRSAENGYYIDVTSEVSYPEFAFAVEKYSSQQVKDVQLFYDLDYDPTASDAVNDTPITSGVGADKHIMIPLTSDVTDILNSGNTYKVLKENCPALLTQRSYFDGSNYTYLVVRVTVEQKDSSGKVTEQVLTKRIKIVVSKELLNLT